MLLAPPDGESAHGELRVMLRDQHGAIEAFVTRTQPGVPPLAVMICFFGNGQTADDPLLTLADGLRDVPLELWGINYAGYGRSEGDATLANVARTARRAFALVTARTRGTPIVVYGSSIGGTAALHVAANEDLAGLVLRNVPPLRSLMLRRYGWWNLWLVALPVALQLPRALDAIANARQSRAPAVFITALDDGIVPAGYQERVQRTYAGPWRVLRIRDAGHNDPVPDRLWATVAAEVASWVRR